MAVIKSQNAQMLLKEAIVLDLGDLRRQARMLQEEAQARANRTIEQARIKAQQLTEGAHEKGFETGQKAGFDVGFAKGLADGTKQGYEQALSDAKVNLEQLQNAWIAAAQTWDTQRQDMDREARLAVLDLAIRLAQRVMHRVIEIDPNAIVDQVKNALAATLHPLDVTLRIHPEDRPTLERAIPVLLASFADLKHVHLIDDATITRGGCILKHGQGQVDATIDSQLHRITELLLPQPVENASAPLIAPTSSAVPEEKNPGKPE